MNIQEWLQNNEIEIVTPQFKRAEKLGYEWKPENPGEFMMVVKQAPYEVLYEMGFRKWDNLNAIIKENAGQPKSKKISIPVIQIGQAGMQGVSEGEEYTLDIGHGDAPTEPLKADRWMIMFPGEWYSIIPDGFMVTGLYGEQYPFQKGKSDDDIRYGCLPYGIQRVMTQEEVELVAKRDNK